MPDRVFAPDAARATSRIVIAGNEAHHLGRVRRVALRAIVEVFDGQGFATLAEVIAIEKAQITLRPVGDPLSDRVAAIDLILGVAFPKGDRADWLIEKATELGVARCVPLLTERTVVDARPTKLDRLRRSVIEASKQCGRNRLMEVAAPLRFGEFVERSRERVRLLAHPGGLPYCDWPSLRGAESAALAIESRPEGIPSG